MKVHAFAPSYQGSNVGDTACGLELWRNTPSEASDVVGQRMEICGGINPRVTCRKCLNAPQGPPAPRCSCGVMWYRCQWGCPDPTLGIVTYVTDRPVSRCTLSP